MQCFHVYSFGFSGFTFAKTANHGVWEQVLLAHIKRQIVKWTEGQTDRERQTD